MFRNSGIALLLAFLIFLGIAACGKKAEESAVKEETAPAVAEINYDEMVLIPAGEFIMGSNDIEKGKANYAYPEHKVNLPAFYIDKYEATNKQFLDFAIKTVLQATARKKGRTGDSLSLSTTLTTRSFISRGTMPQPTARQRERGCRQKRNGKKPLAVPMEDDIPGATNGKKVSPILTKPACEMRRKWGHTRI